MLVLIGFLYKTAQKPLKNRSNLAWKTVQKSPQEMSGYLSKIRAVITSCYHETKKEQAGKQFKPRVWTPNKLNGSQKFYKSKLNKKMN